MHSQTGMNKCKSTGGMSWIGTGTNKCKKSSKAAKNKHRKTGGVEMGHERNKQDQNKDFFPWVNLRM